MSAEGEPKPASGLGEETYGLKREIGVLGSFSMGYADVGADVYVALGILALYAQSAAPLAILIASITYISTGLTYAELASKYPVAGGGNFYANKVFGPIHGFLAGWGLMLDYTVDIALFALASSGYVGAVVKAFFNSNFVLQEPYYALIAIAIILSLLFLNIKGISYSSRLNIAVVIVNLGTVALLAALGFYVVITRGLFSTWTTQLLTDFPSQGNFAYGVTLAMASFIGIESISQAAEETKVPSKVIPKSTKLSIIAVLVIAISLSFLSVSVLPWQVVAGGAQDPLFFLARAMPGIGAFFAIWIAFMGIWISLVSTNTGVIGVSRVTFSMGRLNLMPHSFSRLHKKYRTPYVTISIFSLAAMSIIMLNIFSPSSVLLNLVASLYNFGALVAYMYVNLSAIALRFRNDQNEVYRSPINFTITVKGKKVKLSVIPFLGFISCFVLWSILIISHPLGRIVGLVWFTFGVMLYFAYRRKRRLPIT
ncbi:MAG: APC family permease [Nitrososphaerota archaeon]